MAVRQLKGLYHCKLIKRQAKRKWRKMNPKWKKDGWDECLKATIAEHREKCKAEAVAHNVHRALAFSSVIFLEKGDY